MQQYMFLAYSEESDDGPAPGTPEFGAMMGEWMAYNQSLIDGGHFVSGASLAPTTTATVVPIGPDAGGPTDGPFAETKETIGGYYVVNAANLDEAIALASKVPVGVGHIEVRPVAFNPDAT